jgi:hypothetical protein
LKATNNTTNVAIFRLNDVVIKFLIDISFKLQQNTAIATVKRKKDSSDLELNQF